MIQQTLEIRSNPEIEREIRAERAYKKFLVKAILLKLMPIENGKMHAAVANERISKGLLNLEKSIS
jgi:ribosome maturation factor RimP